MISNPISGAKYFFSGLSLIKQHDIRRYVLAPLFINILIFSVGLWLAINQFNIFITWALASLPSWLSWLEWIMWPLFSLTFYGLVFFTFSIIANIIAAPFNGPLSAAVERHLRGDSDFNSNKSIVEEIKSSIMREFIKLKYSLFIMIALMFFSLISFVIPLLSPIAAILWMLYTVWVLSLEYADFPMENHGMTFPQVREQLASKRFLSLGFGTMVMITTLIPFVNFLVMPIAVAGATKMVLNEFQQKT